MKKFISFCVLLTAISAGAQTVPAKDGKLSWQPRSDDVFPSLSAKTAESATAVP